LREKTVKKNELCRNRPTKLAAATKKERPRKLKDSLENQQNCTKKSLNVTHSNNQPPKPSSQPTNKLERFLAPFIAAPLKSPVEKRSV